MIVKKTDVINQSIEILKKEDKALIDRLKNETNELSKEEVLNCAGKLGLVEPNGPFTSEHYELSGLVNECVNIKPLVDDIDQYLKKLEEQSHNPKTVEDYLWICDTVVAWEDRLSEVLNIARTVPLADAPPTLLAPLAPGGALVEKELELRVLSLAKVVCAYSVRKKERNSGDHQLTDIDMHRAEVFFANDILDGTIDFARRISSHSFWRLEKVWMAEIRELLAYLDWEASGAQLFSGNTLKHYLKAWEDFENRIKSGNLKASSKEFGEVKMYLENQYVTQVNDCYKLDEKKLEKAEHNNILKIKSSKARTEMGKWNPDRYWDNEQNWLDVKNYVAQYYENIIPAVMDGDKNCAKAVLEAFDYSMKGPYRIINAFEMVIVIYFISTDTLQNVPFPCP